MSLLTLIEIPILLALSAGALLLLIQYTVLVFHFFPRLRDLLPPDLERATARRQRLLFALSVFLFISLWVAVICLATPDAFWGFLTGCTIEFCALLFFRYPRRIGEKFSDFVYAQQDIPFEEQDLPPVEEDPEGLDFG
ncbi:MAG: hypothetical protein FWF10_04360 [Clostridiales bacterium]|nr:hypothetical protein [Clostridiales bacterium]